VVWSLWLGVGGQALAEGTSRPIKLGTRSVYLPVGPVIAGLLLFPLVIGAYRYHQLDRSGYWEPRRTAQQILDRVDPNAVILCRWEDCMPLRYLQFVEGRKLGVQLDQTEPEGGTNWADRVPIYAPRHPVYAIAPPSDLAARYALVPIEHVRRLWQVGNLRPEPAAIDIP
jgi:hypothetical protein